jgi:hypothetical protein
MLLSLSLDVIGYLVGFLDAPSDYFSVRILITGIPRRMAVPICFVRDPIARRIKSNFIRIDDDRERLTVELVTLWAKSKHARIMIRFLERSEFPLAVCQAVLDLALDQKSDVLTEFCAQRVPIANANPSAIGRYAARWDRFQKLLSWGLNPATCMHEIMRSVIDAAARNKNDWFEVFDHLRRTHRISNRLRVDLQKGLLSVAPRDPPRMELVSSFLPGHIDPLLESWLYPACGLQNFALFLFLRPRIPSAIEANRCLRAVVGGQCNVAFVDHLLTREGADINCRDYKDESLFAYASGVAGIEMLLTRGIAVNTTDAFFAFDECFRTYRLDICEKFILSGFDLAESRDPKLGLTMLHHYIASHQPSLEKIVWLIRRGADVNAPAGKFKQTPLHFAHGRPEIVQWLRNYGANPSIRDSTGRLAASAR